METLNKKYTDLFFRCEHNWANALGLLRRMLKHQHFLRRIEEAEYERSVEATLQFAKPGYEAEVRQELENKREDLVELGVTRLFDDAHRSTLVFGHSILDLLLNDVLGFAAKQSPESFWSFVKNRQISGSDALEMTQIQIRDRLVMKFIQEKQKESIRKRVELLFSICKPSSEVLEDELHPGVVFDIERLSQVDQLRHDVVHSLSKQSVSLDEIDYLKFVSRCLFWTLGAHFGLTIDKAQMKATLLSLNQPSAE